MRSLLIFRQNSVGKIVGRIFEFAYNGVKVAYNAGLSRIGADWRPSNTNGRQLNEKSCIFLYIILALYKKIYYLCFNKTIRQWTSLHALPTTLMQT